MSNFLVPNFFYVNNGDGTFTRNTTEIIVNEPNKAESYGVAWADYDNDGDLDLIVPNACGDPSNYFYINLYANNGNSNHWFKITCKGVITNRDAIGARVYLKANINGQDVWQMREINGNSALGGGGGGAVSGLVCHFGIGDAEIIDTLKIVWPTSGTTQVFTNVDADRFVKIFEDDNTIYEVEPCNSDLPPKNPGIIKGIVFNDVNNNCVFDSGVDDLITNELIKASIGDYYVLTKNDGTYNLLLPEGNFDISQLSGNPNLCPEIDTSYNINITSDIIISDIDFVKPLGGDCGIETDLYLQLGNPCPGETRPACFLIHNPTGNPAIQNLQTSVTSNYPSFITSSTPCDADPLNSGGTCSHCVDITVPDDDTYYNDYIYLTFSYIGDCQGNPISGDTTIAIQINCAFDPNDKALIGPLSCGENNYIEKNKEIIYKIRFQNVGNAPATDVLISDKLDKNLDISTFHIFETSHQMTYFEVIPEFNYTFSFDSIMLPDSVSDPVGSQGYIIFGIKPKPDLPDGTVIKNQAGIYFDYNKVVKTNVTEHTLMANPYPVADFTYNHSCTNTGMVYDFVYSGEYTGNELFSWDFGEYASPETSTVMNPGDILFSQPGNYNVILIVDRQGCTSIIIKNITVESTSCGKNKILVCHNQDNNPHTICVNINSLPAHIAQGDCIGRCPDNDKSATIANNDNISISYNNQNRTVEINSTTEKAQAVFEIYDYSGRLILSKPLGYLQQGTTIINVQNLSRGIYLGVIITKSEYATTKIIQL